MDNLIVKESYRIVIVNFKDCRWAVINKDFEQIVVIKADIIAKKIGTFNPVVVVVVVVKQFVLE